MKNSENSRDDSGKGGSPRSRRGLRIFLALCLIIGVCAANIMWMFPRLRGRAEDIVEGRDWSDSEIMNRYAVSDLYDTCYVLYRDLVNGSVSEPLSAADIFLEQPTEAEAAAYNAYFEAIVEESAWEILGSEHTLYEYYAISDSGESTNTEAPLKDVLNGQESQDPSVPEELEDQYKDLLVVSFDENGQMSTRILQTDKISEEGLTEAFTRAYQEDSLDAVMEDDPEVSWSDADYRGIRNLSVVFGIADPWFAVDDSLVHSTYEFVALLPYALSLLALFAGMCLLTSRTVWRDITDFRRKGIWYVAEIGVIGIICTVCLEVVYSQELLAFEMDTVPTLAGADVASLLFEPSYLSYRLGSAMVIFLIFAAAYLSFLCIRPLFSLGMRAYIRQYSLTYNLFAWLGRNGRRMRETCRRKWSGFWYQVHQLDFTEKSTRLILKLVIVNFALLLVCTCLWFFGIIGLLIYSVALFGFLRMYYDRTAKNYHKLQEAMNRIAQGDLGDVPQEDMGIFNPLQEELGQIRKGFSRAVDEEVKSQRMKTELISNVSHDLKTPLTAITTYVELLKKEDISPEERRSYVETLERKALRLKVLIEDLFEVSKAQSANVTLQFMDVDLVNLMRQVAVEHQEKLDAQGLDLRWHVPEEKVLLRLDNQKTYRVFENLFVNIEKYAMPNSRVYLDVTADEQQVQVVMKNMSAQELNVPPEELTERFVRGDASRNTEGSGLGLAIVRSFVELQSGTFAVDVDGDLFKAILVWKHLHEPRGTEE